MFARFNPRLIRLPAKRSRCLSGLYADAAGSGSGLTNADLPQSHHQSRSFLQYVNGQCGIARTTILAHEGCRTSAMQSPKLFLIMFCGGIATTLTWQSYGDAARQVIAKS